MYQIGKEEIEEVKKVIETCSLFKINSGLRESEQVEEKLRKQFNCEHAIFMTSGHGALVSALTAMGIGPGDEVIVPAYTYIATAMAVISVGAIPIIAEVDETLTLSPEDFEKKISSYTKAVIPVHIQGFPCNMDSIVEIAKNHGILVLEDACQADGGSYKGKRLGTIGDAGALSFNFFKIITCGEGGALLTNNREFFERALIYQDSSGVAFFGDQMQNFSNEVFCGNEYRSNELCAAVLNVQLTRLESILKALRTNKKYMMEKLQGICEFAPSNDENGDCGIMLAFRFDNEEKARKFATYEGVKGSLPIDADRHLYKRWEPIMKKRGALHPLMDPFKMEANKDIIPDYRDDMCPKSLDILSRTVYIPVSATSDRDVIDEKIEVIKKALCAM
ncbi:MAG: aminotransferase class V-fold PLP-dependent enzyme [Clostridia bacterium]|nr:aminotransferase class V-fold PLP-dependent enzyme [Clostridia bacterium]